MLDLAVFFTKSKEDVY